MKNERASEKWDIKALREHLQHAVDLEFWTIPFYMSAMYSVTSRSSAAFQLVQAVVHQEMLHLQCAANIANAFGLSPTFDAPVYLGKAIPHLNFTLDKPDPTLDPQFQPYSAEIGPLDRARINAMCLVEYPDWKSANKPDLCPNMTDYANIGEFYRALRTGAEELKVQIRGGVKQVDFFSSFYRNMPAITITESGTCGFYQVGLLVDLITDQGEGIAQSKEGIQTVFQNTADDRNQELDHFDKFEQIRSGKELPVTYPIKPESQYSAEDKQILSILREHFAALRENLRALFNGENPGDFIRLMASVGADIQNCWKHGVVPRFS
jgi:Ferritin-like